MNEFRIILLILMILLMLITTMRFYIIKASAYESFIFEKKLKLISWWKLLKIWSFIQISFIFFSIDRLIENILIVSLFPIILTAFILLNTFSRYIDIEIDQKEFDDYKKSFKRQKKINKILNKF